MNSISHGPNPLILVVEAGSALLALEFTPDAPAGQLEAGSHPCMGPYTAFHFATYNGTTFFCVLFRHAVVWCYRCPDLRYFIPVFGKTMKQPRSHEMRALLFAQTSSGFFTYMPSVCFNYREPEFQDLLLGLMLSLHLQVIAHHELAETQTPAAALPGKGEGAAAAAAALQSKGRGPALPGKGRGPRVPQTPAAALQRKGGAAPVPQTFRGCIAAEPTVIPVDTDEQASQLQRTQACRCSRVRS